MKYFIERLIYVSKTVPGRTEEDYISRPLPKRKRKLPMSSSMKHTQKLNPDAIYTKEVVDKNNE